MPKKPNRYGMQEYIPEGHGDESGEYADESGSNIHFTNFSKPKDIDGDKPIEKTKEKQNDKASESKIRKLADSGKIEKGMDVDKLEEIYNLGNQEQKDLVGSMIDNGQLSIEKSNKGYGYCTTFVGRVGLTKQNIQGCDYKTDGETFFHECGHALDGNYWQPENASLIGMRYSATDTFILSNGKTLAESMKGSKNVNLIRSRFKQAKEDMENWKKDYIRKNHPEYDELLERRRNIVDKYLDSEQYQKNREEYEELKKKRMSDMTDEENRRYWELQPLTPDRTYISYVATINALSKNDIKADYVQNALYKIEKDTDNQTKKRYGDVSDMFQAQMGQDLCNMGHSHTYFTKDTSNRASEFFAECFSAEAVDSESLENIKKYFPESYAGYREIIDAIKSGKLKKRR